MDKFEDFSKLDGEAAPAPEAAVTVDENKAAKKERSMMMVNMFKERVEKDPTFRSRHCTLSKSITVENTLSYGDSGNVVIDRSAKPIIGKNGKERLPLEQTSQIVGYRIRNIGDQPVRYTTEAYKQDENGQWVGEVVDKVLEPGGFADLTRKYMTVFCCQPEIFFQLANGKIKNGPRKTKRGDIDAELEAYYFSFNERSIKVNSDSVKINVSTKTKAADGTVKWVVKDEFAETFGYLNNAKSSKTSEGRRKRTDWTPQDIAANYVYTLLNKSGKL